MDSQLSISVDFEHLKNFAKSVGFAVIVTLAASYIAQKFFAGDKSFLRAAQKNDNLTLQDVWAGPMPEQAEAVLDMFDHADVYQHFASQVPKGILLHGKPGTGKTHFARVIASLSGSTFFYASAAEFDEIYVGKGPQRIRQLFEEAEKATRPSFSEIFSAMIFRTKIKWKRAVIFIDEIDAIGTRAHTGSTHNPTHATVSQLLTCLDGLNDRSNIFVIAATNNLSQVDPAIHRSGRFDKVIELPLPNAKSRKQLIEYYLDHTPGGEKLVSDGVVERIANKADGFSAADLKNMVSNASMKGVKECIKIKSKSKNTTSFSPNSAIVTAAMLESAFLDVKEKVQQEKESAKEKPPQIPIIFNFNPNNSTVNTSSPSVSPVSPPGSPRGEEVDQ